MIGAAVLALDEVLSRRNLPKLFGGGMPDANEAPGPARGRRPRRRITSRGARAARAR